MKPGQKGARRARYLLFTVAGIHIGSFLLGALFPESGISMFSLFSGWLTLPGTLIVAVFLQLRLEPEERRAFWLWTLVGLCAVAAIWVTTCGLALSGIGM